MKITTNISVATAEELAKAFPEVDPGFKPFGSRIIVQLRKPKIRTSGGIILSEDSIEIEKWNTQIGRVCAIGQLAFKNRDKMTDWPEGAWANIGDFIRIPKFNQDKWEVEYEDGGKKELALFMLINDLDLLALKIGNPLEVKAYI